MATLLGVKKTGKLIVLLWLEQIINTDLRKYPFKGALIDFKFARQFISQDIVEDNRSISLAVSGV